MIDLDVIDLGALIPIQRAGRAAALVAAAGELAADAVLLTDSSDIRWCSGFTGSSAWVVARPDHAVLITDLRYRDRAVAELQRAGLHDEFLLRACPTRASMREAVVEELRGASGVAARATRISHAEWTDLVADIPLIAADPVVPLRRIKDPGEVARLAEAARIADAALAEVAPMLADGLTEIEVRDELDTRMRRAGADGPSYDTIVASGPEHAARPHHGAEHRRIREGDLVVIDLGALVDGYHSDMTRTFVVGDPSPDQHSRYNLVLAAQTAALACIAPGIAVAEVDRAARDLVTEAGHGEEYLHATGHGVGLEIHEPPVHAPTSTEVLVAGDVVTVEPGLYRAGVGGVRIEDLVVVTDSGPRILTRTPKDDPCLPSPPTT